MGKTEIEKHAEKVIITVAGEIRKRGGAGGDKLAAFSALINAYCRLSRKTGKMRMSEEEKRLWGDSDYYSKLENSK